MQTLLEHELPPGRLLLAFSGGADSLFLLAQLALLAPKRSGALYVSHALRSDEELREEIALNKRNAESLAIPFAVTYLEKGRVEGLAKAEHIGLEAAARRLRYESLEKYRAENGYDYILTAHHRDDQAETILMRLLDSAPFYALSGIRRKNGRIYRPLLSFKKSDMVEYLEQRGLCFSYDSTNSDVDFKRNYIRHYLLPLLSESERNTICNIARNVDEYRALFPSLRLSGELYIAINRVSYLSSPRFIREEAIYECVHRLSKGSGRLSRAFIDDLDSKITLGRGRITLSDLSFFILDGEVRVYREVRELTAPLVKLPLPLFDKLVLREDESGDPLSLRINLDELSSPVIIRTSRAGDSIRLKSGRVMISDLERGQHIPYSLVLEDREGIRAYFARFLGGRDRLSAPLLGHSGCAITVDVEKSSL